MTVKKLIGQAPSQAPRNRDLGSMAYQDVSLVKGPAFKAYRGTSTQTISANTWTKVQLNTVSYDTSSAFDATNYRFTPKVAGYYQCSANILMPSTMYPVASIQKNAGEEATSGWGTQAISTGTSALVYLNGSTDYLELYIYSAGTTINTGAQSTFLTASLVRPL